MKALIPSLIWDDLYKLTMFQAVFNQFPRAKVRYTLQDREPKRAYPKDMNERMRDQLQALEDVRLTTREHTYLTGTRFVKPTCADYLLGYKYDASEVETFFDKPIDRGTYAEIGKVEGYWYRVIWWEVKLLLLTSACSFHGFGKWSQWLDLIKEKGQSLASAGMNWVDMGTRRAFDLETQEAVVKQHRQYLSSSPDVDGFRGTSNMYLAMAYDVPAVGTIAHEFYMAMQAIYGPAQSNRMAMEHWIKEYEGDLGIVLPDTLTTDIFLKSFDRKNAKLWDGPRLDSGDLLANAKKFVDRYRVLGIDPADKVYVPSDGLTVKSAIDFRDGMRDVLGKRARVTAGIGTHLVNDCGFEARKIVCKIDAIDPLGTGEWINVVKLSDEGGKASGDGTMVKRTREILGISA